MLLKRGLFTIACSSLFMGSLAMADPTFTINAGALTASRLFNGGGELDDVRGLVQISVSGFPDMVSLTDSTNGTDPNFLTLAFGNTALTGFVSQGPQAASVAFNFGTQVTSPTSDTIVAIGTPMFPDPTTDPALLAFEKPLLYTFTLSNFLNPVPGTNSTLAQYTLTSVAPETAATPEPAWAGIIAVGLLMLVGYLRLRRSAAARS